MYRSVTSQTCVSHVFHALNNFYTEDTDSISAQSVRGVSHCHINMCLTLRPCSPGSPRSPFSPARPGWPARPWGRGIKPTQIMFSYHGSPKNILEKKGKAAHWWLRCKTAFNQQQLSGLHQDFICPDNIHFISCWSWFIKSNFIGHIHMVSRCYCECGEMLVLLVPTVQQYLTSNKYQFHNKYLIHTNLSKGMEFINIWISNFTDWSLM